jgi:hypothetical protein
MRDAKMESADLRTIRKTRRLSCKHTEFEHGGPNTRISGTCCQFGAPWQLPRKGALESMRAIRSLRIIDKRGVGRHNKLFVSVD